MGCFCFIQQKCFVIFYQGLKLQFCFDQFSCFGLFVGENMYLVYIVVVVVQVNGVGFFCYLLVYSFIKQLFYGIQYLNVCVYWLFEGYGQGILFGGWIRCQVDVVDVVQFNCIDYYIYYKCFDVLIVKFICNCYGVFVNVQVGSYLG